MKKFLVIGGSSLLLLVAILCGAFFAGPLLASAHGTTATATKPTTTTKKTTDAKKHEEHPLREFVRNHKDEIVEQIAPQLHLTVDQLKDRLQRGERLVDIAKDQKISVATLKTIIEKSVNTVIEQQVDAHKLDAKRATLLRTLVEKHPFVVGHVLHRQYSNKK